MIEPQQYYQHIEKAVESQSFSPLYFFFGEEPYLLNQAVNYLKVCALHGGAADFNFNTYYSADVDISLVKDEVETLPMMAPRRVVLLKEVHDLTDKEWAELEPLFQTPVDSTVFILVGGKVDKRKKFYKILAEKAIHVEFKKPYENQIPGWIRQIAKSHSLTITDESIQLFHRLVGHQLLEVESEIIKLKDFISPRTHIEIEDVAQCVSKKREESVFDLVDALAMGDKVLSLNRLVMLLDQGQNEIGIVSLVSRHLRILMHIKQGLDLNLQGLRLAQHAHVPHYFVNNYVVQSKQWSLKRLEQALVIMADTDRALKSSPLSSHIWLENMVLKSCALVLSSSPGASQMGSEARIL